MITLVRIGRELCFRRVHLREEGEPLQAVGSDPGRLNGLRSANQLPEIIPIERSGIVEFRHQGFRLKRVTRLPELEHDEPPDERSVKGSGRKNAEVVDVARFTSLIAGADLLGDDLGQGKARDDRGFEGQVPEVTLLALGFS